MDFTDRNGTTINEGAFIEALEEFLEEGDLSSCPLKYYSISCPVDGQSVCCYFIGSGMTTSLCPCEYWEDETTAHRKAEEWLKQKKLERGDKDV